MQSRLACVDIQMVDNKHTWQDSPDIGEGYNSMYPSAIWRMYIYANCGCFSWPYATGPIHFYSPIYISSDFQGLVMQGL